MQAIGRNAGSKQFADSTNPAGISREVASPHQIQDSAKAPFQSLLGTEVDESVVEAVCAFDEKVDTSTYLAPCAYADIPFESWISVAGS